MTGEGLQEISARLVRYRRWLVVAVTAVLVSAFCVAFIVWAVQRERSNIRGLESQTQALSTQIEKTSAAAELVNKRIRGMQGRIYLKSMSEDRREMDERKVTDEGGETDEPRQESPYAGIERCDLPALPEPTGEFDPLVAEYFDLKAYLLVDDRTMTGEMQALAQRWAQVRPAAAYVHLTEQWEREYSSNMSKEERERLEQVKRGFYRQDSTRMRLLYERDAVFVACLRQLGFLPPR